MMVFDQVARLSRRDIFCTAVGILLGAWLSIELLDHFACHEFEPFNQKPFAFARTMLIAKCFVTSACVAAFLRERSLSTGVLLFGACWNFVWLIPVYGESHKLTVFPEANYRYQVGVVELAAFGLVTIIEGLRGRRRSAGRLVLLAAASAILAMWLFASPWMLMPDI